MTITTARTYDPLSHIILTSRTVSLPNLIHKYPVRVKRRGQIKLNPECARLWKQFFPNTRHLAVFVDGEWTGFLKATDRLG